MTLNQRKRKAGLTNSMICVYANASVKAGCEDAFLKVAETLIRHSRGEAGNVSYHLCKDPSEPLKYVFMESWMDEEALDLHMAMPHFIEAGKNLEPLLNGGLDIHKLNAIL